MNFPKTNTLEGLNRDCLIQIFDLLAIHDLYAISQVSSRFAEILSAPDVHFKKTFRTDSQLFVINHIPVVYLRGLLENVGRHIRTLYINFEHHNKMLVNPIMDAFQKNCRSLRYLHMKQWGQMQQYRYLPMMRRLDALYIEECYEADGYYRQNMLRRINQLKSLGIIRCSRACLSDGHKLEKYYIS